MGEPQCGAGPLAPKAGRSWQTFWSPLTPNPVAGLCPIIWALAPYCRTFSNAVGKLRSGHSFLFLDDAKTKIEAWLTQSNASPAYVSLGFTTLTGETPDLSSWLHSGDRVMPRIIELHA
jgi:hypothetical protein